MKNRSGMKFVFAVALGLGMFATPQISFAGHGGTAADTAVKTEGVIDAPTAMKKAEKGELVLLDIRTPQEWKDTGVGSVAEKVSMHQPGFLQKLNALIDDDKTRPIALICATGGRSNWLQGELQKRGYTNVIDVAEGMLGSRNGPGWLKRGLPIVR